MYIKMKKINVDLDGVLVDFMEVADKVLTKHVGYGFHQLDSSTAWFLLHTYQPDIYRIAKPTSDYQILWNALKKLNPTILTAIPSLRPFAMAEVHKKEWVSQYLGHDVEIKFGPYSVDKQKHCQPGDVLIDDNQLNIKQWIDKGGIGILHTDSKSTIQKLKELNII